MPRPQPQIRLDWRWSCAATMALALGGGLVPASAVHAQVRVSTWNIAKLIGDPTAVEEVLAALSDDDRNGFAVAPAILVFEEVTSGAVDDLEAIVDAAAPAGVTYARATYTTSSSEDSSGGAIALFHRTDLFVEVASGHRDISTGAGRKSDRWQLRLVGYPEPIGTLWVYGCHLKASNDASSAATRLMGAEALRDDIASLGSGVNVVLVGDFNMYTSGEDAYAALTTSGPGVLVDPLGNGDWVGESNAIKHSQSPRDISAGGLTGGAMDDRFDFQLHSPKLGDGTGLDVIAGSYRSVGNDGNHYNEAINAGNNSYFPGQVARSNALADALFDASDHIPVIMDLHLPGVLVAAVDDAIGRTLRGSSVPIEVWVQNTAPAETPWASLPIPVEVVAIDGAAGTGFASAPLAPAVASTSVMLDTATPGEIEVLLEARASGDVVNAVFPLQAIAEVVDHAQPSLEPFGPVDEIEVTFEVEGSGSVSLAIPIYNLGYDGLQSLLEVDSAAVAPGPVSVSSLPAPIAATPGELLLSIDAAAIPAKGWSGVVEIEVSDEDLPGEAMQALYVQLTLVPGSGGIPGDLNGDGIVNGADLAILLGAWGGRGPADLNGDGIVDGADLAILLGNWSTK